MAISNSGGREGTWCPITKQQRRGVFGKNDKDKLGPKPSKLPKPSSLDHFQAACRKWETKAMLNNRLSKSQRQRLHIFPLPTAVSRLSSLSGYHRGGDTLGPTW